MKKRESLLLVSIIAIAVFLIIFYFNIYEITEQTIPIRNGVTPRPFPMLVPIQYRLWLSPIVLIIAIVPISYYFISKKLERNMKIVLNLINKNNFKTNKDSTEINNKNTILKLLNFNERKVLERLIERKGEILQSEISRIKGMNKLKAHRAIRNLELRGVIETESYGKTKHIILSKDIKNIMLK
jgi:preprotein translocase subunit YajC